MLASRLYSAGKLKNRLDSVVHVQFKHWTTSRITKSASSPVNNIIVYNFT